MRLPARLLGFFASIAGVAHSRNVLEKSYD